MILIKYIPTQEQFYNLARRPCTLVRARSRWFRLPWTNFQGTCWISTQAWGTLQCILQKCSSHFGRRILKKVGHRDVVFKNRSCADKTSGYVRKFTFMIKMNLPRQNASVALRTCNDGLWNAQERVPDPTVIPIVHDRSWPLPLQFDQTHLTWPRQSWISKADLEYLP